MRVIKNILGRLRGYGGCNRCGDTWNWKEAQGVPYGVGRGCFPLCRQCYMELSPEERFPYYEAHLRKHHEFLDWDKVDLEYVKEVTKLDNPPISYDFLWRTKS